MSIFCANIYNTLEACISATTEMCLKVIFFLFAAPCNIQVGEIEKEVKNVSLPPNEEDMTDLQLSLWLGNNCPTFMIIASPPWYLLMQYWILAGFFSHMTPKM